MATTYVKRQVRPEAQKRLVSEGVSPLMARLLASRGVESVAETAADLGRMLQPNTLKGAAEAGRLLADAVVRGEKVTIVADYDCDGASACAIMLRALTKMGAQSGTVGFLVPDRQKDGYGLTPAIVDRAIEQQSPDVIVTVDNGIASFDGVRRGLEKGVKMLITDHHLPAVINGVPVVPEATVLVNPSQPGCAFESKALCGAGVAFYVMLLTRAALRERGVFDAKSQPRLDDLLDLVALATVADVVRLDENNRRLVAKGLERIRTGASGVGIQALFSVAGRNAGAASAQDLAFAVAPRVNAAGRLADMRVGIECLATDDEKRAEELAGKLNEINKQRRDKESEMAAQAEELVGSLKANGNDAAIVVHDESFHEGIVGIVAGRIKEREHRPTFVFATSASGELKGSGRSIPGFHMRDALDLVTKRCPDLIVRFGGHAMAAGCTIRAGGLGEFRDALAEVAKEWLTREMLERKVMTDGELPPAEYTVANAAELATRVWGQGFDAPLFLDSCQILEQRVLSGKHLKLSVRVGGQRRDAIWFRQGEAIGKMETLAYRISVNEWNGRQNVQMIVDGRDELAAEQKPDEARSRAKSAAGVNAVRRRWPTDEPAHSLADF